MSTLSTPTGNLPTADLRQDFVSSDTAALASHMNRCASSRSRFFNLHAAAESLQSVFVARMVTAALLAAVLVGATALA